MKILRIIYDWPPPWAGLVPGPFEITRTQAKLGHVIDVFCGRWPKSGPIEQVPGVTLHSFMREPLPGTLNLTTSFLLFSYYLKWRKKNNVDLIHSHGHFAIWIYLYRLLLKKFFPGAKELKTPLVVHFHNTVEGREQKLKQKNSPIKWYSQYISWPLGKLSDKWAVQVGDALIFAGVDNRDQAINYYNANPSKCFVLENGVNTRMFSSITREEWEKTRRELNLDPLDKVILNTGMMLERKNIHLLVEALIHLPENYKLMLVGPGDPDYLQRLTDLITKHHLQNRVIRVGYTPYLEQPISYQASDIFVLPSSFEGFPKVVMESLSCGVPILVSGFKFQEDIEGVHYITNLNASDIATQIKEIVENPNRVNVSKINNLYSWEAKMREVDKIYEFAKNSINK